MADKSVSDLVQRVRDLLYDINWETTSTTTTTSATVAVPDGTLWETGAIGEWQTGTVGYEQFLVTVVAANNLTVVRGYNGTTAETHTSGDRVVRDPLYSGRQIQQALTNELSYLWPFVYKTGDVDLTPLSTTVWYDLNAATVGVVRVTQLYGSSSQVIGRFGLRNGEYPFEIDYVMPTGLVASGKGIRFPYGMYHSTNHIHVIDMRVLTGTSDIPDNGQFPVSDCLVWLAAGRLVEATETKRDAQGMPQDTQTSVSTGVRLQSGAYFKQQGKKMLELLKFNYQQFYQPIRVWNA
jgi:hypothetical protein